MQRSLRVLVAAVLTLLITLLPVVDAIECAAPPKTLTYSCGNVCADASTPCWLNSTASTSNCVYKCYSQIYDYADRFIILIPYGTWKSPQELAYTATLAPGPASQYTEVVGDTKNYTWTSNDQLEKIEALKLRSTTTSV